MSQLCSLNWNYPDIAVRKSANERHPISGWNDSVEAVVFGISTEYLGGGGESRCTRSHKSRNAFGLIAAVIGSSTHFIMSSCCATNEMMVSNFWWELRTDSSWTHRISYERVRSRSDKLWWICWAPSRSDHCFEVKFLLHHARQRGEQGGKCHLNG